MARTNSELRQLWRDYECDEAKMMRIPFGPDSIRVAAPAVAAFTALAEVISRHGYAIRPGDTDSYVCRAITGGKLKSLHAYGIAVDVNWQTNPYRDHPGTREPVFSDAPDQADRAKAVLAGHADTDMTSAMIAEIEALRTRDGRQVFKWGGHFGTLKDAMHFELDVGPNELAAGLVSPA
ncbi:MAG: M15 family metallopeptidase [Devosia sp.]